MINSKQRSALRSMANTVTAIFQIGKGGISDALVSQLDDALEKRELIKISVLETCELAPKDALSALADRLGAEPVQAIGRKIVLYRESRDNKKIEL